jgi:sensor histidine kinase regulating citrate/malate metabolism
MPRYLIEGSYTEDGTKGLLKEGGTSRRDTVTKLIEGMGGTVEAASEPGRLTAFTVRLPAAPARALPTSYLGRTSA